MNAEDLTNAVTEAESAVQPEQPKYDLEALNAFGEILAAKRKEAMVARASSGIEDDWQDAEDAYQAIDELNRPEKDSKPRAQGGSSSNRRPSGVGNRSTVFVPITAQFVDFAAARAADILLPTDDRGFAIELTPNPDVEELAKAKDQTPIAQDGTKAGDAAAMMLAEMKKGAEAAQTRIDDWLAECNYNAEARRVLQDAAKIGTGVIKGPFAANVRAVKVEDDETGETVVSIEEKTQPKSKAISAWDLFPDPACGNDIHQGSYTFERDRMPARGLAELKKVPGYIAEAIDLALKEGPNKSYTADSNKIPSDCDQFEVWYYYGFVRPDELKAAGQDTEGMAETDSIPVMVVMVNDRVIRAVESPLESGCFPYDVMCWSRRADHWAGTGVAQQMRTPQRMINAATRAMLDNAGRSSAPQLVINRLLLEPADGSWEIVPGKIWFVTEEGMNDDVRKAFMSVDIPNNQAQLQNIINYALEMAERVTGMPMLAQGQQGAATQTVGGMTLLDRNASTPLRMIAKNFDDMITVPHIQRYYEFVLLYGPDKREKANFKVVARGSSILFERDAQNQALMAMGQFVINPAFGKSPKLWIDEVMRGQRLDPARLDLTEEEIAQMKQAAEAAQQQGDPRLEAAKIAADARLKAEEIKAGVTTERTRVDTDRDLVYVQAQQERDRNQHMETMAELQLRRELALIEFANKKELSLQDLKAELAQTSAKLELQRELSMLAKGGPEVVKAPNEPAGRALPGHSYEQ